MEGVKDLQLVPAPESQLAMIERMASNPATNPDTLERLVALYERATARTEEIAFNAAMSAAQKEMRPIAADASNPQTRSKYASYEKLDRGLRPIYTEHGFGVSFDTTDSPVADCTRVLAYVTHALGHARTYRVDMPSDGKGAKGGDVMTKTHAVGSAVSYGMRYLLKMIFNVAVGEDDDDGNRAANTKTATAPDDYGDWLAHMESVVAKGCNRKELNAAWYASDEDLRNHATQHDKGKVEGWKAAANLVTAEQAKKGGQ